MFLGDFLIGFVRHSVLASILIVLFVSVGFGRDCEWTGLMFTVQDPLEVDDKSHHPYNLDKKGISGLSLSWMWEGGRGPCSLLGVNVFLPACMTLFDDVFAMLLVACWGHGLWGYDGLFPNPVHLAPLCDRYDTFNSPSQIRAFVLYSDL